MEASGGLKTIAVSLHKIANDIRLMGCGPRAGLSELLLPEVQPGSSIMPGKINPVISESVVQVVAQVIGNDATIALAGNGGYFELNTMMPVAAYNIQQSISLLAASANNFAEQCVTGIEATATGPEMVEKGLMLGTALTPAIGYDAAASIAKEAAASGQTIRQVAKSKTELTDPELDSAVGALGHDQAGVRLRQGRRRVIPDGWPRLLDGDEAGRYPGQSSGRGKARDGAGRGPRPQIPTGFPAKYEIIGPDFRTREAVRGIQRRRRRLDTGPPWVWPVESQTFSPDQTAEKHGLDFLYSQVLHVVDPTGFLRCSPPPRRYFGGHFMQRTGKRFNPSVLGQLDHPPESVGALLPRRLQLAVAHAFADDGLGKIQLSRRLLNGDLFHRFLQIRHSKTSLDDGKVYGMRCNSATI